MKVQFLQHVPAEGPGSLLPLFAIRGFQCKVHALYQSTELPALNSFDWLVVMGGPMGVYDEAEYPWLVEEKKLIHAAIQQGKRVMGICLGAQLIAHVLGATIRKNTHKEIGWFPISKASALEQLSFGKAFPDSAEVFHWHGDTFDIPSGALPMASSEACQNQGFVLDAQVYAFQFHPEITEETAKGFIEIGRHELDGSRYVQSDVEILNEKQRFKSSLRLMETLLEALID